jgi:uncharacterized membrane protein
MTTTAAVLPQELQAPILLSDEETELVAGGEFFNVLKGAVWGFAVGSLFGLQGAVIGAIWGALAAS